MTTPGPVTVTSDTVTSGCDPTRVAELLEICDDYLRHAPDAVHAGLDQTMRARGNTGGPSWLIDMLGFTALQLRACARTLPTGKENPDE